MGSKDKKKESKGKKPQPKPLHAPGRPAMNAGFR